MPYEWQEKGHPIYLPQLQDATLQGRSGMQPQVSYCGYLLEGAANRRRAAQGSKGGRLPPPLVPHAKRNKMQDSSMEEGENKTEESGHLVSVLQLFLCTLL